MEEKEKIIEEVITRVTKNLTQTIPHIVKNEVQTSLGSKIDKLQLKFDQHETKMAPVYEVFNGAKNVRRFTIWVAGFLAAVGTIVVFVKGLFGFDWMNK